MPESDQRKKSWWQFRLRSLLLLMLIVAAYFAGWSAAMRRVRRSEAEAREQLRRALRAEQKARDQAFQQVILATDRLAQEVDDRRRAEYSQELLQSDIREGSGAGTD